VISHAPTAKGGAQTQANFWSSLLLMHTAFDAELPNLTWYGNTQRRGLFLNGHATPQPKRRDPSAHQIWGFLSIYVQGATFQYPRRKTKNKSHCTYLNILLTTSVFVDTSRCTPKLSLQNLWHFRNSYEPV